MTPYNGDLQAGAGRRPGVDLQLDGKGLLRLAREAQIMEQPWEADECGVNRLPVADPEPDSIPLCLEQALNPGQQVSEVVRGGRSLQSKVEILGTAREGIQ